MDKIKSAKDSPTGLIGRLDGLNKTYNALVNSELDILPTFKETIQSLTSIFNKYIGSGNIFDFLHCTFIGNNVDIILKYLKEAIGKNIYSVGIFLIIAGVAMIFSIIFTILEVIIINNAVSEKQKESKGISPFGKV